MPDLRRVIFVALSSITLLATIYSVAFHTYLDTSDPLVSSLKHPHHDKSYWARKSNLLNQIFIKRAWGWTSVIWALLFSTSSPTTRSPRRAYKWIAATLNWMLFTTWFFGPAIIERLTTISGGQCVVRLPSGGIHSVPVEYCYERTLISPITHPELFITPFLLPGEDWRTRPRLMRGHDVSGHIFLLTLSSLFLADELRHSLRASTRTTIHNVAISATAALIGVWLFAVYTTSLYFHTPFEKLTGFLAGLGGFLVTQLPPFQDLPPEIIDPERQHKD